MGYQARETRYCTLCGKVAVARRLCRSHYNSAWKADKLSGHSKVTQDEAFDMRVQKSDTCWIWTGTRTKLGYGIFLLPGEIPVRAHRYLYEREVGPIPEGLILLHSCDNPPCVNPSHLTPGTRGENIRDSIQKGRWQHGERHHNDRLTDDEIRAIRADDRTNVAIGRDYRVTPQTIGRIKRRMRHQFVE